MEEGYDVYLRVLGKYTEDPLNSITLTPGLSFVKDENDNDLLLLGLVTPDGVYTPTTYYRYKGKDNKAIKISDLFRFTGDVCYLNPTECPGYPDPAECEETLLCCADTDEIPDGIYDVCIPREDTNGIGGVEATDLCTDGEFDFIEETAYCHHYENEWIFNIGDLVEYLWDVNNQGVKLLQVRFYPRCEL